MFVILYCFGAVILRFCSWRLGAVSGIYVANHGKKFKPGDNHSGSFQGPPQEHTDPDKHGQTRGPTTLQEDMPAPTWPDQQIWMWKSTGRIGVATGAGFRAAQQDHKYRTHIEHRRAWSTAMVLTYYARTISLSRKTGIFLTRTFVLQPGFNFLTRRLLQLLLLAQRIGQYSAGCSTWWLGRGIFWVGSTNGMKSCTIKMCNCCHHHNITEWKLVRKETPVLIRSGNAVWWWFYYILFAGKRCGFFLLIFFQRSSHLSCPLLATDMRAQSQSHALGSALAAASVEAGFSFNTPSFEKLFLK